MFTRWIFPSNRSLINGTTEGRTYCLWRRYEGRFDDDGLRVGAEWMSRALTWYHNKDVQIDCLRIDFPREEQAVPFPPVPQPVDGISPSTPCAFELKGRWCLDGPFSAESSQLD